MQWTATQRFVFLGLKLAHQGDDELQSEERAVVVNAARAMAMASKVDEHEADEWIKDAIVFYEDARAQGRADDLVKDSVAALGGLAPDIRTALLRGLRHVAMACDGVNRAEHEWIQDLREAWGVDLLAEA